MKVISICPSNTEIIDYLGKIDLLIGVDNFSDCPVSVHDLPKLGPDLSIDMDKVEALKPDLVLASLSVPGMEKNIEELDKRKIPYIILNPNSLQEIADDIKTVGKVLGYEKLGMERKKRFLEQIEGYKVAAKQRTEPPVTLYWEWWPKPVFTPGQTNWLTEISELVGGRNIFATEQQASVQTNWEEVKRRNPEHICMVWVGVKEEKMKPKLIMKRPGWMELVAIKNDNIHVLEESLYCRPSPRLLLGLEKLYKILH